MVGVISTRDIVFGKWTYDRIWTWLGRPMWTCDFVLVSDLWLDMVTDVLNLIILLSGYAWSMY
ncbi:hypothetical protein DAI22_08g138900 [Oryza sativa Japonica Group]|jgi:hypothetical protein|nr:hypothetical protein DAI22_08g138900 [Oryza sativa Japonica Group]